MKPGTRTIWTFVITSIALFMVVLDNLVVSTAIPVIRVDLGASLEELEWTVNAYTLTFAVVPAHGRRARRPLRPQAHVHDRRRDLHRGVRGSRARALGRLADRRPRAAGHRRGDRDAADADAAERRGAREKRGAALGAWSGIAGLAVAMGPLVGGAVVEGISWQWIFWLNVPVGLVLLPLATPAARSPPGPTRRSISRASRSRAAACSGSSGGSSTATATAGRARRSSPRWPSGAALLAAFVAWERRTPQPMLPMRFFRNRAFAAANGSVALHVLRDVRLDLPADAVLPDRAGVLAARVGPSHPAVDGHADVRRADRGGALRPDRRAAADGDWASRCRRSGSAGSPPSRRRPSATHRSWARSSSPASAWRCSSRPWRTSSSRRFGPEEEGKASGARTTRSARSGACSASPCSHRSSPATAATSRRRPSTTGSCRRSGSARSSSASGSMSRS